MRVNPKMMAGSSVQVTIRCSALKEQFVRALGSDLTRIGARVDIRKSGSRLSFFADLSRVSTQAAQRGFFARACQNRREQIDFLSEIYGYARARFTEGAQIIPSC